MRCVECGHEIKDGAVFCIRCGAMQVSNNANKTTQVKTGTTNATAPRNVKSFEVTQKRAGGGIVVFIIAAIAVLAAIVALAMFALNPGSSGGGSRAATVAASGSASSSESSSATSSSASSSASKSSSSASSASSKSSSSASAASASAGSTANGTNAGGNGTNGSNANNGTGNQQQGQTQQGQQAQQTQQQPAQQQPVQQEQPAYTEPAQPEQQAPAANPAATDSSYVLGDTASRVYSKDELRNMSSYDLWIARNEIFARYGRMFTNSDLQAYFNNKTWYTPTYTPEQWDAGAGAVVSSIESQNAALMLEVEQERNSEYL